MAEVDQLYQQLVTQFDQSGRRLDDEFIRFRTETLNQIIMEKGIEIINQLYRKYAKQPCLQLETRYSFPANKFISYKSTLEPCPRMSINVFNSTNQWLRHYETPQGFQLERYLLSLYPKHLLKVSFTPDITNSKLTYLVEIYRVDSQICQVLIESHQADLHY